MAQLATGIAAAAMVVVLASPGPAGATPAPVAQVQLVVKLVPAAATRPASVLAGLPGALPRATMADRWFLRVPAGEVAATLLRLAADRRVVYASTVGRVKASDMPNDPCYVATCGGLAGPTVFSEGQPSVTTTATQGDLAQIGAPAAWSITHGSPSVLVAVLDTGVRSTHQDLSGNVVAGPVICAADDATCQGVTGPNTDDAGHGTHVAGTVAAVTNNGAGVASLGWNTHAESFKVLDAQGNGSTADVADGIYAAVKAGASVINMSLGNVGCSVDPNNCGPDPDTMAAVQFAEAHNVVLVAAAGNGNGSLNGGITDPTYPAGYPGVLSVAAVDARSTTSGYSEYGGSANIAAPGDNILSTWYTGDAVYSTLTGTSMATPHVAAAAALVRAANPSLSAAQVTSVLESSAGPVGGRQINGGLLNVPAALSAAASAAFGGYRLAGSTGAVYAFGADPFLGDVSSTPLARPVVGSAGLPGHNGYWTVASDGGVFSFGAAAFHGSTGSLRLNRPIVGMAATPSGQGYWLVASDGGIFSFGDAAFQGSTGALRLNRPIVGMAATPSGRGYWLVASDGGIFSFGDAAFDGSTGSLHLNQPVVGMAAAPSGQGYWLVASDGGIFSFDAPYFGSAGDIRLNRPVVGMSATSNGGGYVLAASDGGLFTYGNALYRGSTGGQAILGPIVSISG